MCVRSTIYILNSIKFCCIFERSIHLLWEFKLVAVHAVSEADASSPASFVVPGGHDMHSLEETYSLAEHKVTSHIVSGPHASSPASFVVPGGQGVQTWDKT